MSITTSTDAFCCRPVPVRGVNRAILRLGVALVRWAERRPVRRMERARRSHPRQMLLLRVQIESERRELALLRARRPLY